MPIAHIVYGSRVITCLLILATLMARPQLAMAQAEDSAVVDKITKMNKKAVEEYENLNFEEARKILKEALDVCSQNGLDKHPIKARTHIHLGIVILAGFKQRELAVKQFRKALDIQPDIKLTKSLANPEVQEAFDEAVAGLGKPEKPDEGGAAGGDKTSVSPAPGSGGDKAAGTLPAIDHDPVTRATQGDAIGIDATVDPALNAKKVVLAYRPDGASDFLGREMKQDADGDWSAEIPASATSGNTIAYYIEAQNEAGDAIATRGTANDPLIVTIKGAGAPEPGKIGEDGDAGQSKWYLAIDLGSGAGYTTGHGEVNTDHNINPAGIAPAKLGHLAPELGYFVRPGLLLSLQLRLQLVTGPTPVKEAASDKPPQCGSDYICSPASSAFAAFARLTWFFGSDAFVPFAFVTGGGGEIRHVTEFSSFKDCGTGPTPVTCVDTVVAGPVFAGGGAGFVYYVAPHVGLTLGAVFLLGFPNFTAHVDLNGGLAFRL